MESEKLVLSPVLNFISRARKAGCIADAITKIACDFFKPEEIVEAKKLLWPEAVKTRPTERQKPRDNIVDMIRAFDTCDEKRVSLPRYVIFEPDQVPIVPGEITATLTRKLNEFYMEFKSFAENSSATTAVPPHPPETSCASTGRPKALYSVVVKNPPKTLDNPNSRKDFLDSLAGDSSPSIVALKPSKDEWRVIMSDKGAANALAEAITKTHRVADAKVKTPAFFGIVRHTPPGISSEDIQGLITSCVEVVQIRMTRSFRLKFETKEQLQWAIDNPPIIGYERLPVSEYKFLPPQCYNCQAYGHTAHKCVKPAKCSNCSGPHKNLRDNPCQLATKCALCGKTDHPCYSYKCPEALKLIK